MCQKLISQNQRAGKNRVALIARDWQYQAMGLASLGPQVPSIAMQAGGDQKDQLIAEPDGSPPEADIIIQAHVASRLSG
jgi:hypothetical protein